MTRLNLENYWSLPRVNSLELSPDGTRLILAVEALAPDGKRFTSSLWEVPASGSGPARRLTYSEKGEGAHAFLPDGTLVFASARPDVTLKEDETDGRLFTLSPQAGEARPLMSIPAGVGAIVAAAQSPVAVIRTGLHPDVPGLEEDAAKAKARKDAGVSGILFDSFPIRFWDRDLGPRQNRLLRLDVGDGRPQAVDLTSDAGNALAEGGFDVSADGSSVVAAWWRSPGGIELRSDLVLIRGGERRVLAQDAEWDAPAISPDGRQVVARRETYATTSDPSEVSLWLFDLASGEERDITPGFPERPDAPRWAPDGRSIWFTADEGGRAPLFNVEVATAEVRRVASGGAYSSVRPSRDGRFVYALRASFTAPNEVVRIDVASGEESSLPTPGLPLELPGRVEEVVATAADGVRIRSWLVLPEGASATQPAPLLLWIHGGPYSSWNAWSWRWCPHLMAERGYAVLLPDPALSTGYGGEFLRRAHGVWGKQVWADLQVCLEQALERPDLDGSRTAAMGGSFGGYMANWIAGQTDRFKAIVTHASLWDMEQFAGTTDVPDYWEREFGSLPEAAEHYLEVSPRSGLERIRTPMLVVHGQQDFRVPYSEGLRLYTDLRRRGVPVRYLYFPDENHWVLKPGNSRLWYETVVAFLDEHVLGAPWQQPELL